MIIDINSDTLTHIKNPKFSAYAKIYVDIYQKMLAQISQFGLELGATDMAQQADQLARLKQKGAIFRNDSKSIYVNAISPACVACQTSVGSATFFISLRCHRNCFYCFNPNQVDYEYFTANKRDAVRELEEMAAAGQPLTHVALTGGEPLLFKEDAVAFFKRASELYPNAHKRLYTCGDLIDKAILEELRSAGLSEIRFSIRMHDLDKGHRHVFDRIALARAVIPSVMVEMPVLPGTLEVMQEVLLELDRLGIDSANLLEFCYPWVNPAPFAERGYQLKRDPYRIPYNYWYAGGLPIVDSEAECLDLLEFALDRGLKLGVHYCSLENKHTGQIYQQNFGASLSPLTYFSNKDFFLKSAKVYGADIQPVKRALRRAGYSNFKRNQEHDFLEFGIEAIPALKDLDVEIGIAYSVMETRDDGQYLRELKVDLTYPKIFDLAADV